MRPILLFAMLFVFFSGCKACNKDHNAVPQTEEVPLAPAAQTEESVDEPEEDLSAYTHEVDERWWIGELKEPCMRDGEADTCLRIRREGRPTWQTFYGDLRDFTYEEGNAYILEVTVLTKEENAPENEERYVLKEQIVPALQEESSCKSDADCAEDEMCTGPAGCFVPWTCEPRRPCTEDLRQFCSCDGETMEGSSTCPPAPYKHPGACPQ